VSASGVAWLPREFTHLATFTRSAARLLTESDVFELKLALLLEPRAGDTISGRRGLRKLRRPLVGRGKSGGARVIYYYVARDSHIYLVFACAKNRRSDLTKMQLTELAAFVASQVP
jgi:hypothetical protein